MTTTAVVKHFDVFEQARDGFAGAACDGQSREERANRCAASVNLNWSLICSTE